MADDQPPPSRRIRTAITPEQAQLLHAMDTVTGLARQSAPLAVAFLNAAKDEGATDEDARYLAGVFLQHLLGGKIGRDDLPEGWQQGG